MMTLLKPVLKKPAKTSTFLLSFYSMPAAIFGRRKLHLTPAQRSMLLDQFGRRKTDMATPVLFSVGR